MATVYQYEIDVNTPYTTYNFDLSSNTNTVNGLRVVFNDTGTLDGTAPVTAYFVNTAGVTLSSGPGALVYDTAYNSDVVYLVLPDRSSFAVALSSSLAGRSYTATVTSNNFEAWGPTERRLRHLEYI